MSILERFTFLICWKIAMAHFGLLRLVGFAGDGPTGARLVTTNMTACRTQIFTICWKIGRDDYGPRLEAKGFSVLPLMRPTQRPWWSVSIRIMRAWGPFGSANSLRLPTIASGWPPIEVSRS